MKFDATGAVKTTTSEKPHGIHVRIEVPDLHTSKKQTKQYRGNMHPAAMGM
jgi:hypothetical protein